MDDSHSSPIQNPLLSPVHADKDHYAIAKHLISQPLDIARDHALLL